MSRELQHQAKVNTASSLRMLHAAFAGDDALQQRIMGMVREVEAIDVKPLPAAVGMVVIGDAVASSDSALSASAPSVEVAVELNAGYRAHHRELAAAARTQAQREQPSPPADAAPTARKRQRRATTHDSERRLDDFPPGKCEVLLPRQDGEQRWNEYCLVVGHSADGRLVIRVPGEASSLLRSISAVGSKLGDDDRPPVRACATPSASSASGSGAAAATIRSAAAAAAPSTDADDLAPAPAAALASAPGPGGNPPTPAVLQPRVTDLRSADEQIAASQLRRSESRTREQLNQHLDSLGLGACFGVPVVSKKNGILSHLTFNIEQWNDLPATAEQPFEWWLGEGEGRLRLANAVNPDEVEQPKKGVPVFFAVKRKKGGALVFYGGHYKTQSFRLLEDHEKLRFKDRDRQAIIELAFHRFDDALCASVNAIPAETT